MSSLSQAAIRALLRTLLLFALAAGGSAAAQEGSDQASSLERGITALRGNRPQEARDNLEEALRLMPANEEIYLHLGLAYEQLGLNREAIAVLQDGLGLAGTRAGRFYLNIANNYTRLGQRADAHDMYSRAVEFAPDQADAYLNRANLTVHLGEYAAAVADYERYLDLAPDAQQAPQIRRMIALLREEAAAEELRREREAERQRQLLDAVLDSLEGSDRDARNLRSESEDVIEIEDEFDIAE